MIVTPDITRDLLCDAPQETYFSEEPALLRIVCREDCESYI